MEVTHLGCEYRHNPLGIDILQPRLSWQLQSARRGARQTGYQLVSWMHPPPFSGPALEPAVGNLLWDTGKIASGQSTQLPYSGPPLRSRQRIFWRVRVWDENEQPCEWSHPSWFEMGLLDPADWQAVWIGSSVVGGPRTAAPCPYLRKDFSIEGEIATARLYVTALGLYDAYLNGQRVGDDVFTPGWTDYHKRVQYQTYDVTGLLCSGPNRLGAILGDGWYCGYVGWGHRQLYGDRPRFLAQLEITLADGTRQVIATDGSWQTATGPLLESDLIMGEAFDARLSLSNWHLPPPPGREREPAGEAGNWSPVCTFPYPPSLRLVAQNTPTVRAQGERLPVSDPVQIGGWPVSSWIFDFGQNMVGRLRMKVRGERGTTLTLRFAEMLDASGSLYTANLRGARQTDYYTLAGDPDGEVYESRFTFHGFRYVELTGYPGIPAKDALTAIVLHSDNPVALEFECSDPLVNQLQHNIRWGWKGNSLDVPTDCPQRDERLGWTGDAQVFAKTATYLTQSAGFFTKWVQDLADSQLEWGAIPSVAPVTDALRNADGGPAWSDAFIIVPWTVWQQYGDTRILETHYDAMCRYLDYLVENSPGLIRLLPGEKELGPENKEGYGGYGDWLAQDGSEDRRGLTPRDLIGTAFLAYDARLMAQIAAVLEKGADAEKFNWLYQDTRQAFIDRFITSAGLVVGQTQTAHILALLFDLVPQNLHPTVVANLVQDLENRKMHMSTGFVGTPYITQILTDTGRADLAYALLLQQTFPSWLYSVLQGATTIWERWDGWTEERGFQNPGMNSFNHYAYGAVGAWMYENIAGIRTDPAQPGFRHVLLQPRIPENGNITWARGTYFSPYGSIESHWRVEADCLTWEVTIPPNTTADAHIPAGPRSRILEGGTRIEESAGVTFCRRSPVVAVYALQPGSYRFEVTNP